MLRSALRAGLLAAAAAMLASPMTSEAQAPLAGTQWRVVEIVGAPSGDAGTLRFGNEGKVTGKAACNSFFGAMKETPQGLEIGPIGATRMYCEGRMELEQALFGALQATRSAERTADGLVLRDGTGKVLVRLAPLS